MACLHIVYELLSPNKSAASHAPTCHVAVQPPRTRWRNSLDEPLFASAWTDTNKEILHSIATLEGSSPRSKYSEAQHMLKQESITIPLRTFSILFALFAWVLISDSVKNVVVCGGVLYWLLVLSVVPLVALVMTFVRQRLIHKRNIKREVRLCNPTHIIVAG